MELQLDFVTYPSMMGRKASLGYMLDGTSVYFSGITDDARTTINDAEGLIVMLSRLLKTPWQRLTFFDIQTWRGYPGTRTGWWCCDQLQLVHDGGRPWVRDWVPVACWPYGPYAKDPPYDDGRPDWFEKEKEALAAAFKPTLDKLKGIPAHVLARFQPLINEGKIVLKPA